MISSSIFRYKRNPASRFRVNLKFFQTSPTSKMRIPYTPNPPKPTTPVEEAIVERIVARRAPRPLQPLDLALLHSPHVADGWNSFLGAIRTKTSLPDDIREIAICRVAVCNGAGYEWAAHAPLAEKGGVSKEGLKVLGNPDWKGDSESGALSNKQLVVAKYADAMTKEVRVGDSLFAELKELFSEKEVMEITATVWFTLHICDLFGSHAVLTKL
jgi:alkylhydroperoxidase family enzyme